MTRAEEKYQHKVKVDEIRNGLGLINMILSSSEFECFENRVHLTGVDTCKHPLSLNSFKLYISWTLEDNEEKVLT